MRFLLLKVFENIIDGVEIKDNKEEVQNSFEKYTKINYNIFNKNKIHLGYFNGTNIYEISDDNFILIKSYKSIVNKVECYPTQEQAVKEFEFYTGVDTNDYFERISTQISLDILNDFDQTKIFINEKSLI